jgi:hypothetical protein
LGKDDEMERGQIDMRAKFHSFIFLLAVVLAGSTVYAGPSDSKEKAPSEIGRFQLFQGNYISIDLKRQQTSSHMGVFLLDTKTGAVKRYLNKIDEQGKYIETWLPTDLQAEK